MTTQSCLITRAKALASAPSLCLSLSLMVLPIAAKADPTLWARGYAEATTVGTYDELFLHNATSTDSVTRSVSIADSHIPGLSGTAQVSGTATFGALSGSGSASATGRTALSYFQAQPVATAQDFVTIFASGPVGLTLHYTFEASTTVPNDQPGTVDGYVRGKAGFYPSGFVDNSQIISDDNIFAAGNTTVPPWTVIAGDASHGAAYSISGSTTVEVDPGATYGLYGSLELFGMAQNLNFDGHEIDIAAAGSLNYWISFDSPNAYLTSQSGATYEAPGGGGASVPEASTTVALLGLGLAALGFAQRWRAALGASVETVRRISHFV